MLSMVEYCDTLHTEKEEMLETVKQEIKKILFSITGQKRNWISKRLNLLLSKV